MRFSLLLAFVASLAISACGGGNETAQAVTPAPVVPGGTTTGTVTVPTVTQSVAPITSTTTNTSSTTSTTNTSTTPADMVVAYTSVYDVMFRPFASGEYVFRTDAELKAALTATPFVFYAGTNPATEQPVPSYNFETSMVVGLSKGVGSLCFTPVLKQVMSNGTDVTVNYSAAVNTTQSCNRPSPLIAFALVPKVSGKVKWVNVLDPSLN